ncbi:MAG: 50S ribosomal protein L30 [Gammaproteobacteria bacterium]|nr:50S ribosomal protein L30 [Gammaproteobacteria bacterium]MDH4315414.1 50S ribosomal protein L30 [Gammaproteobacteria bacterium]MDH5212660.1 50S ribosomal protein L30 [Gammaproteobacteria bacterium]
MAQSKQLKVTLMKSRHGRIKTHRDCIAGLGLSRIRQCVTVLDTPQNRGMINKVSYLLSVEEV